MVLRAECVVQCSLQLHSFFDHVKVVIQYYLKHPYRIWGRDLTSKRDSEMENTISAKSFSDGTY